MQKYLPYNRLQDRIYFCIKIRQKRNKQTQFRIDNFS